MHARAAKSAPSPPGGETLAASALAMELSISPKVGVSIAGRSAFVDGLGK